MSLKGRKEGAQNNLISFAFQLVFGHPWLQPITGLQSMIRTTLAIISALLLVVIAQTPSLAKKDRFAWNYGLCTFEVRFDTNKVDKKALIDTGFLVYEDISTPIAAFPTGSTIEENVAAFDQECRAATDKLKGLTVLPLKGFEARRKQRIGQVEEACAFGRAKLLGLSDSGVLRDLPFGKACLRFVDALDGKSDFLAAHRKLLAQQCASRDMAVDCQDKDFGPINSPDFKTKARTHLLEFGWNNCMVEYLQINQTAKEEKARRALTATFEKAFKPKVECEEP
jgi:hypothetical protein